MLVYGRQEGDSLESVQAVPMTLAGRADGEYLYEASFGFQESGTIVYGVRVRPARAGLPNPFALHLAKWA